MAVSSGYKFSFSNPFDGYVNSFNGTKQSRIIATLANDYGINTIKSFIKKITEVIDKMHINLPTDIMSEEEKISYAGALVLQNLIIKKLETIKSTTPEGITMRDEIRAQHTIYDLGELSDQKIMEQANERLLGYFRQNEFRKKLVGDMPITGSLNAGSKKESDGYTNYLRDLFGNQTLTNIRTTYLEPADAVTQCSRSVCTRPSTGTCYLCGCWWDQLMASPPASPSKVECEHILPVLPALSHLWLYRTYNPNAGTKVLVDKALKDALSIEYAWSHKCCNQIKSDKNFTKLNKLTGKYEIDNDAVTLFLMALENSNRPECTEIKKYCPDPYPTECGHKNPACPVSISGKDKIPCNIEYTGLTTGSTVISSAIKLKSNTILEKRLQDIVDHQNGNLVTISKSMNNTGNTEDRDYYYYLVLCKFKLMAAIDDPSFLHDMLLGWSKPQKPKSIGDETSLDPCLVGLEESKTKLETEIESMLNKMTELNNAILDKVEKVKKMFPNRIEADNSINLESLISDYTQVNNEAQEAYSRANAEYEKFRKQQEIENRKSQGSDAIEAAAAAGIAAAADSDSGTHSRPKRARQGKSDEKKNFEDAKEKAKSVSTAYNLLTKYNSEIQSLQYEKSSITNSYNTRNADLQKIILQIKTYNSTYKEDYTKSITHGVSSADAHKQARQAAHTAAKCTEATPVGGMGTELNLRSALPNSAFLRRKRMGTKGTKQLMQQIINKETMQRMQRIKEIIDKAPSLTQEIKDKMIKDLKNPTQEDRIILELLTNNKFNPTEIEIEKSINAVFTEDKTKRKLGLEGGRASRLARDVRLRTRQQKREQKTKLPFISQNTQIRKTRKRDKKTKLLSTSRTGRKTTRRGSMGKCYIQNMADGNLRIIRGRRRYITKNFNLDPRVKLYINKNANEPNIDCIKVAQNLDNKLKKLRKTRKRS